MNHIYLMLFQDDYNKKNFFVAFFQGSREVYKRFVCVFYDSSTQRLSWKWF